MISRLMLNLHTTTIAGIFSTTNASTGVAFTSRAPDLNLPVGMSSNETDFEMVAKAPMESIVEETRVQEIEVQPRWYIWQEESV